jgi:hypothetical protein
VRCVCSSRTGANSNLEGETLLDQISRARKASIEIYRQNSILRITADKTTAEYAANDVEEALRNSQGQKMHLKPWLPYLREDDVPANQKLATLYPEVDLQMVTSFTRTSIQRLDTANTVGGLRHEMIER